MLKPLARSRASLFPLSVFEARQSSSSSLGGAGVGDGTAARAIGPPIVRLKAVLKRFPVRNLDIGSDDSQAHGPHRREIRRQGSQEWRRNRKLAAKRSGEMPGHGCCMVERKDARDDSTMASEWLMIMR
ncbi:hypothetical protein M440DRAFT_121991 [Trichoderma longibrachiatum ATCC 18648]|uniref:Uncharacterized protein n=1 Tax=Trichoderma longibrachiatum ATCC 18648 TaxID=983965 RepID=A0A2T4BX60_TRILO|nr:hypothetical protein M440DRAFT_121991 [Trichoderma longibrachiatum ATCC 18648]